MGDPKHECACTADEIRAYRNGLDSYSIDRFDLHIEVPAVRFKDLADTRWGEKSAEITRRIVRAQEIQTKRGKPNRWLSNQEVSTHCAFDHEGGRLLEMCIDRLGMSARAYFRILKTARTIADLDGAESIKSVHLSEAIQYRTLDRAV